ncbi:MAG: aspartate/glutamate racemase family protein [Beijerinckiaceae bacterium]
MKLLIINPNTTDAMTRKVEAAASAYLPPAIKITAVGGRFGPAYIASRAAFAVASHAALDAYAAHGAGADAILLACFGDPGLDAIREVSPVPAIGLVEASAHQAGANGRRFSIVTGGALWEPMLRESLLVRGLSQGLASIRTVAPDGGTIARDPQGALTLLGEACDRCIREDGAEAVVLGGVGLIGLAERLQETRSYPVICSVIAGFRAVESAGSHQARGAAAAPVSSAGLSRELTALFGSAPAVTPPDRQQG